MKPKGYLVFHLNLAFSSIEEKSWPEVINACYHPLLNLIETTGVPAGIELTGWTLEKIEKIDGYWIERFNNLRRKGLCELIGSGYCQIVGPLVPYTVNHWNQKLGLEIYKELLFCKPDIVLVNEMAFSSSLVDLYNEFDYEAMIMDRDNVKLSLASDDMPTHALGVDNSELPILWSDSILFQKLQHFAHGDISIDSYLTYLKDHIDAGEEIFPIYCNDAEVFDYRPGRFIEERPTHIEGEWKRIERLLESIISETSLEFILPSAVLEINKSKIKKASKLVSSAYPVPVKKQAKYNISRWAITGKNDLWLNTMCHRIENYLTHSRNNHKKDWEELCELWGSDLRTHITEKKWTRAKDKLNSVLKKHDINNSLGRDKVIMDGVDVLEDVIGQYGVFDVALSDDGILLRILNEKVKLDLNLRRGLAIQSLAFSSHNMEPCLGSLPHGYFTSISLGADFYSGGVVAELPVQRTRFTDLEKVEPKFFLKDNGDVKICAEIKTPYGRIIKVVEVSANEENISLGYAFPQWDKMIGSLRLGVITLLNKFSNDSTILSLSNGGKFDEFFNFKGDIDHVCPASSLVSSSRGLGATTGRINVINCDRSFVLKWDPSECAVMPMLYRTVQEEKALSRVLFSMKETDDTAKKSSISNEFSLEIST